MHEDAGGIGQDEIEDLVNIERLSLTCKLPESNRRNEHNNAGSS